MAFQSVKSFTVADDNKLEAMNELENLYKLRDNLLVELKQHQEDKRKIKDLKPEIKKLTEKKKELEPQVLDMDRKLNDYRQLASRESDVVSQLKDDKDSLLENISHLNKLIDSGEKDRRVLEVGLEKIKRDVDEEIKEYNANMEKLIAENDSLVKRNKELVKTKDSLEKSIKELSVKNGLLEKKNRTLTQEIDSKSRELNELVNQCVVENGRQSKIISDFESSFAQKKMEANDSIEKMYKDKEVDIIKKEGRLSEKESWLMKRELKLKEIKGDLEVFYNKKLDNIIF
jgi:chromosome segregation ATPase